MTLRSLVAFPRGFDSYFDTLGEVRAISLLLTLAQTALILVAVAVMILSATFAYFAYRVARSDRHVYESNRKLFGGGGIWSAFLRSFRGQASTAEGQSDHYRRHAGLAYDLETGQIEAQGRLSKEAIRSVYEPFRG